MAIAANSKNLLLIILLSVFCYLSYFMFYLIINSLNTTIPIKNLNGLISFLCAKIIFLLQLQSKTTSIFNNNYIQIEAINMF
ncbi:hypothetical protein HMPREF9419_0194 [Prevotella nigrescens ATCC 33563]|nr:hypothetical protein HMPREF9419_0194 [Prevotella nigrescens ATCC 33563]